MSKITRKFLYEKVYDDLKNKILTGKIKYEEYLLSEKQLADYYSVERTTIRHALSKLVDEGLVEKKGGKGTRVIYNFSQKNDDTKHLTKKTIALILPRKSDSTKDRIKQPFYSTLFSYIEKEISQKGLYMSFSSLSTFEEYQYFINQENLAGIIFVSHIEEEILENNLFYNIPSVIVNNVHPKYPSIITDNFQAGYLMCNYLLNLGHRKIGIIKGFKNYYTSNERLRGVRFALSEFNLKVKMEWSFNGDWEYASGYKSAMKLINNNSSEMPTALIAFNDYMALGAIQAFNEAGIRVPEDISVVGYDDILDAEYVGPKITTVNTYTESVAHMAVQLILDQLNGNLVPPVKVLTPIKLLVGQTSQEHKKN